MAINLRALILALDQGEWDRITELEDQLLSELKFAENPTFVSSFAPADLKKVEIILPLLHSAIEKCSLRQEQIAPLINAFAPPNT